MPASDLIPVILCGGAGTRLWPLSRSARPKQFHVLTGTQTLLQQTVLRATQAGAGEPVVVTGAAHGALVRRQLAEIGVRPLCIIEEPCPRNTAPAIALAAHFLQAARPGAAMWVMPSDHMIGDVAALAVATRVAADAARKGYLATFGVRPASPHTGYGYIRSGSGIDGVTGVVSVAAFLEKPDRARAERFLADGGYYWNSGMFVFAVDRILAEIERYAPEVAGPVTAAWQGRTAKGDTAVPAAAEFDAATAISIDYAVMERTDRAVVAPLDADWSDIGSWAAIWDLGDKDEAGNAIVGRGFVHDSRNCYAHTAKPVALVGVDDLIVVESDDAILVCRRDKAELVKHAATAALWAGAADGGAAAKSGVKADAA
ncbi:MAG: mannose-1-phosphate guanylyltransferase/mannose-6-phosphate isomerase [Alphaproteobacteria bacterium]